MVNHCTKLGWFCTIMGIQSIGSRYVGPTTNSAYLNDHCLSPFDCVGLMDVVAENGGWGGGGVALSRK